MMLMPGKLSVHGYHIHFKPAETLLVSGLYILGMSVLTTPSVAQTREYLICTNDTFIYPSISDGAMYRVDFGDGTIDSSFYPMKHVFAGNGKYKVEVKRTVQNATDTTRFVANVGTLLKPGFETNASCYLYRFTNLIPDTVIVNGGWLWNFGNGAFSNEESPSYLYQGDGNYKVSLQYARKNQCNSSTPKTISVSSDFYPGFDYHANNNEAIFLPLDTSQAYYHWDFGDKDTTDSISPVHAFNNTGKFPVSLTIKSASGCETIYTDTISVTSAGIQPMIANANLFAAYPNPFSSTLIIHYEIIGRKNVILNLYDATGRQVANIIEGVRHTGRYDIHINPAQYGLRAGLYFLGAYFDQEYLSQKLIME